MVNLLAYAGGCAIFDASFSRIPNILHITYFSRLLIEAFLVDKKLVLLIVLRLVIGMVLLYFLYRFGFFGAGDVKMISLIVAGLGIDQGLGVVYIGMIIAGAYSVVCGIRSNNLFNRFKYIFNYLKGSLVLGGEGYVIVEKSKIRLGVFLGIGCYVWAIKLFLGGR